MTIDEALEQMKEWLAMMTCDPENRNPLHLRYVETVKMAIKALEIMQGTEDKDYEQGYKDGVDVGYTRGYTDAMSDIYERGDNE